MSAVRRIRKGKRFRYINLCHFRFRPLCRSTACEGRARGAHRAPSLLTGLWAGRAVPRPNIAAAARELIGAGDQRERQRQAAAGAASLGGDVVRHPARCASSVRRADAHKGTAARATRGLRGAGRVSEGPACARTGEVNPAGRRSPL